MKQLSKLQNRTPKRFGTIDGMKREMECVGPVCNAHLPTPNPKDPINSLARRDQCNIFRLRTGHINLNFHRNRIDPLFAPMCRHCMHPYETVEHFLIYCDRLVELRKRLLPPNPTIENCLYSNSLQLKKTSQFYLEASRVYEG